MKRYVIASIALFVFAFNYSVRADEVISLAGDWNFRLDPQHLGHIQKWHDGTFSERIKLPGSTDEAGHGNKTSGPANGSLSRPYIYEGPAWYQTDFIVPDSWQGKRVTLFLERCHWQTEVWVDGQSFGMKDSLCVPHVYDFGRSLTPGKHRLTICVDNTYKIDVGTRAHSVTDHTQTNWNGIIGRMELKATDPVWIEAVDVYPDLKENKVEIKARLRNITGNKVSGQILANAHHAMGVMAFRASSKFENVGADYGLSFSLPIKAATTWDEFSPFLYELGIQVDAKSEDAKFTDWRNISFGMREIGTKGTQFVLNGRPTMLRGNLECCIFPLTGYPAMDVESWKRRFEIARSYGLNHVRFHSWCPPEAAFIAADQTGFLLQIETPVWTALGSNPIIDEFVTAEADRILAAYGNHPSFTMLCAGNEPKGRMQEFLSKIVPAWKAKDSRRIYTGASGWAEVPENQYHVLFRMSGGGLRIHGRRFVRENSSPDVDFSQYVKNYAVPLVAHELGQWLTYPDFGEIAKYTGVLKPRNLESYRDRMAERGMLAQNKAFHLASGRFAWLLYKEEIETALRTPGFGGFQLLSLQDFPGQGEALVGLLDSFWETKNIFTPEQMRRFCSETVPLARFAKFTWTADENFSARLSVAHYGPKDLPASVATWIIKDSAGREVASGSLPPVDLPTGNTVNLGDIQCPLDSITKAGAYRLTVALKNTPYINDWDFWVYPKQLDMPAANDVIVADNVNADVIKAMKAGKKVLFISPNNADGKFSVPNNFLPVFWSFTWFPDQKATLGMLCDPKHPALADFSTDFHSNWQWWEVANRSRAFILNNTSPDFLPIVQAVDDYHRNNKLGVIFEAQVGNGRVILCGMDIQNNLDNRPVARQLRYSLLKYMGSPAFEPKHAIDIQSLKNFLQSK
jgi:beta-galactosidase